MSLHYKWRDSIRVRVPTGALKLMTPDELMRMQNNSMRWPSRSIWIWKVCRGETGATNWVWINTYENTIFRGMNIHKSQLFWCELQGYKVLTHCQLMIVAEPCQEHTACRLNSGGFRSNWGVFDRKIVRETHFTNNVVKFFSNVIHKAPMTSWEWWPHIPYLLLFYYTKPWWIPKYWLKHRWWPYGPSKFNIWHIYIYTMWGPPVMFVSL